MCNEVLLSNINWIILSESVSSWNLTTNLTCGQSFRWRLLSNSTIIGVFRHRVWHLKQEKSTISYRVLACLHWAFDSVLNTKRKKTSKLEDPKLVGTSTRLCNCSNAEASLISTYLQIGCKIEQLYTQWIQKDKSFKKLSDKHFVIRVLRQDPLETLFSFLCSANNSISRIVAMIEKMCKQYGKKLLEIESYEFYDFPTLQALAELANENHLRELGFGYRASYIISCAKQVLEKGGETWLDSLQDLTYKDTAAQLIQLPGVGMKVADCVCLMALNKTEAVPIDTHVRQIAIRDYSYQLKSKSLTKNAYEELGNYFRSLWGDHAGWAQAVLFAADIKSLPHLYEINLDMKGKKAKILKLEKS